MKYEIQLNKLSMKSKHLKNPKQKKEIRRNPKNQKFPKLES